MINSSENSRKKISKEKLSNLVKVMPIPSLSLSFKPNTIVKKVVY